MRVLLSTDFMRLHGAVQGCMEANGVVWACTVSYVFVCGPTRFCRTYGDCIQGCLEVYSGTGFQRCDSLVQGCMGLCSVDWVCGIRLETVVQGCMDKGVQPHLYEAAPPPCPNNPKNTEVLFPSIFAPLILAVYLFLAMRLFDSCAV